MDRRGGRRCSPQAHSRRSCSLLCSLAFVPAHQRAGAYLRLQRNLPAKAAQLGRAWRVVPARASGHAPTGRRRAGNRRCADRDRACSLAALTADPGRRLTCCPASAQPCQVAEAIPPTTSPSMALRQSRWSRGLPRMVRPRWRALAHRAPKDRRRWAQADCLGAVSIAGPRLPRQRRGRSKCCRAAPTARRPTNS